MTSRFANESEFREETWVVGSTLTSEPMTASDRVYLGVCGDGGGRLGDGVVFCEAWGLCGDAPCSGRGE